MHRLSANGLALAGVADDLAGPVSRTPCPDGPAERRARLALAVEQQLLPRLLQRHRTAAGAPVAPEALAALALADGDGALRQAVQALHGQGLTADAIGLDWLAPAARTLGRLWERDDCSFADVTIGTGRLLRELRHLDQAAPPGLDLPAPDAPHVLLMPAAGEQHTFGLALVADAFRRAGWRVTGGADGGALDPLAQVAGEPVDVVGISVGSDASAAKLPKLCAALRRAACRPGMGLLAGGAWMVARDRGPVAALLGADAVAPDAPTAVARARRLLLAAPVHRGQGGAVPGAPPQPEVRDAAGR